MSELSPQGVRPYPDLPLAIQGLGWLVGTWRGTGHGECPTFEPFRFEQEMQFRNDGRTFLHYTSRSWLIGPGDIRIREAATESGYWRANVGDNAVELVLSHPTGITELWIGAVTGQSVELATDAVTRSATAKAYTAGRRLYGRINGDNLGWVFEMAAMGQPLTPHLSAELVRI